MSNCHVLRLTCDTLSHCLYLLRWFSITWYPATCMEPHHTVPQQVPPHWLAPCHMVQCHVVRGHVLTRSLKSSVLSQTCPAKSSVLPQGNIHMCPNVCTVTQAITWKHTRIQNQKQECLLVCSRCCLCPVNPSIHVLVNCKFDRFFFSFVSKSIVSNWVPLTPLAKYFQHLWWLCFVKILQDIFTNEQ